MDDRELRKLNRQELMEMLLELSKENDRLKEQLDVMQKELQSKKIKINEAGNIAEASLGINRVFEAAHASAVQYIANIQLLEKQKQAELYKIRELRKRLDETLNSKKYR